MTPGTSWDSVHALSQTPLRDPRAPIIAIRRTATIRAGTRMVKLLSDRQLSAYLHGRHPVAELPAIRDVDTSYAAR